MRTELPLSPKRLARCVLAPAVCALLSGHGPVRAQSADAAAPVRRVHVLKTRDVGIPRPTSLAYGPSQAFVIVAKRGAAFTDLVLVSHELSVVGRVRLNESLSGLNMAFDARARRLLLLETGGERLWILPWRSNGSLDASLLASADVRHFGVQDPKGMAVDPRNGHLYILDAAVSRLVRVEPGIDGGFDAARVATVDLHALGAVSLRGLACHPVTGHLHLLNPDEGSLYEVKDTGELVATRDVSSVGLRSPQAMTFAPSGDSTDASSEQNLFIADAGQLSAAAMGSKAAGTSTAGAGLVELSLAPEAPLASAQSQSTALLVHTTLTSEFNPPSPDPSGIEYIADLGTLWIGDGEVDEMSIWAGKNIFETSLGGVLQNSYSTLAFSNEPTGVAVNPSNRHLFYSDDNARKVFEIDPGFDRLYHTPDDVLTSFSTSAFGSHDPEGAAYDPLTGKLLIADGESREVWIVSPGANGVFDGAPPAGDDTLDHFDTLALGVSDPEGIAVNPDNGHIYIIGEPVNQVFELDASGFPGVPVQVVQTFDISAAHPVKPAGLALGPTSTDPTNSKSLYIVDRVVDNNSDPAENDGKLYEMAIIYGAPPNTAPVVSAGPDQSIPFPATAFLNGSVTDDGLPSGTTTSTWSKRSGPGSVTFGNANAVNTTASFSTAGTYVLRLTGSDGALSTSDDITVAVLAPNEVRVSFAADDAEEHVNGVMNLTGNDLELVNNNEGGVTGDQTVGLRFRGVALAPGSTITNAYVQFQADETHSAPVTLTIQGEAADNAPAFVKTSGNISSRPRTTASATWSPAAWTTGDAGTAQRTGNITSVIQEIVNRPGWASGNSLVLIITGTGKRVAESYDGLPLAAALLHIESNSPPPANQPPSVNAGPDQALTLPDLATLDGIVTDDGRPTGAVTTTWSKLSGPGAVTFGNVNDLETYAIFSAAGPYVLHLEATDGALSAGDDMTVTVNNAGQSTLSVTKKTAIHSSTDASSYSFPSITASNDRLYVVFLNTATGSGAAPSATSVSGAGLTFTEIGTAGGLLYSGSPGLRRIQAWRALASAGASTGSIAITLDGTSTSLDAVLLEFNGMDTSGTNGSGAIAQSATNKVTTATSLTVPLAAPFGDANDRPVAFFSHRAQEATVEETGYTELDDASHASPTTGAACEWNAANPETTPSASWITAAGAGGFAIEVRIAGSAPPPNQPPSVNAGPDTTVTLPAAVVLDGTVTDDGLPNPPGAVTTTWSKQSGPGTVTFGDASAVDTTATFSASGVYVLRLTASDGALSPFDEITVTVNGQAPLSVIKSATIHSFTDASSYSFPSITASNNLLYVVFLNTAIGSGAAPSATSVSGAGLTFTEIGAPGGLLYSGTPGLRRIQAWGALATSGAATGSIAINLDVLSLGMDAVLLEFSGMDTSGTNGSGAIAQSATNKATGALSFSVQMAVFGNSNNRPVAFFSHRVAEVTTEEAGYTELDDGSHTGPTTGAECEWNASTAETSPSASWLTAADAGAFAIEVKRAP